MNITCGAVTIKYASWTRRVGVASQGVHVLRLSTLLYLHRINKRSTLQYIISNG